MLRTTPIAKGVPQSSLSYLQGNLRLCLVFLTLHSEECTNELYEVFNRAVRWLELLQEMLDQELDSELPAPFDRICLDYCPACRHKKVPASTHRSPEHGLLNYDACLAMDGNDSLKRYETAGLGDIDPRAYQLLISEKKVDLFDPSNSVDSTQVDDEMKQMRSC